MRITFIFVFVMITIITIALIWYFNRKKILVIGDNTGNTVLLAGNGALGGIAVLIALSETQNAFLVQLKTAIEHTNGHNGTILVSTIPEIENDILKKVSKIDKEINE